jgi:hypothetical protein
MIYKCKRICPKCEKEIQYSNKYHFIYAVRDNRKCKSCCKLGSLNHSYGKQGYWNKKVGPNKGIHLSKETKEKLSKAGTGRIGYWSGKVLSDEHKQKLRESMLGKICPSFNPVACQKIDEYGKQYGYNFQHALNGGEVRIIGYSLDGYDKKKNVVIEYYEKRHHNKPNEIEHDIQRKNRIIKHLKCKFIEILEG